MKLRIITFLALASLAGCSSLKVEPSESDLHFSSLATVWDEAMPLGNATLGELVWQKEDRLRLSLDRIDLWDLRPTDTHTGEHFSFDWVKSHIKSGNILPLRKSRERRLR